MRALATDDSVEDSVSRRHDPYHMDVARAVRGDKEDNTPSRDGANCRGSKVGAVLVLGEGQLGERIVSTGYNGTPAGFLNCLEGGCLELTEMVYTSGSRGGGGPMTERELTRNAARRLAIIRHAQEASGNVARTCRYYGHYQADLPQVVRRYEEQGSRTEQRGTAPSE
jgi:hypothetical protein